MYLHVGLNYLESKTEHSDPIARLDQTQIKPTWTLDYHTLGLLAYPVFWYALLLDVC